MRKAIILALSVLLVQSMVVPATQAQEDEASRQMERDQRVEAPAGDTLSAIEHVQQAGLMVVFPDGKFHPERTLTRAQLAVLLNKAFKLSQREPAAVADLILKDVPNRHWAFDDIETVITRGIMRGYREGYFYPEQPVSRAEALAILAQAYGVFQFDDATVDTVLSNYPDSAQIPAWARKAVATSLKYGFADVEPSAKIHPLKPMTRGDMAYALSQYMKRLDPVE